MASKPFANYTEAGTLTKLHLYPTEQCNADDAKDAVRIKTRKQMLEALLFVTRLRHLCENEYE